MKDIEKLKLSLKQAMEIAEANIEKAENIDLVDMAQTLESFIDELNDIGDFESYNELAEKLLLQKRAGIITEGQARKMMEVLDKNEESITSFKSISDMSNYLKKGDYDELDGYSSKELSIINKHIKSDILDKGKTLSPSKLNSLIIKLEDKYGWY
jgi:hypothetical protein